MPTQLMAVAPHPVKKESTLKCRVHKSVIFKAVYFMKCLSGTDKIDFTEGIFCFTEQNVAAVHFACFFPFQTKR